MRNRALIVFVLVAAALAIWIKLPRAAFYGPSGPTRLGRWTNRAMVLWSGSGLPPHRQQALEIRGRTTGLLRSLPVVVATVRGERYLVAMLGSGAAWVLNARAGGEAALRHGRRQHVRLVEVFGDEQIPILREYLRLAPGARPFANVPLDATDDVYRELVGRFPVFHVVPTGVPLA